MTPENKAESLWMNMFQKQIEMTGNADGNLCIKMALICVDEIISEMEYIDKNDTLISYRSFEYWQSVKDEINKL